MSNFNFYTFIECYIPRVKHKDVIMYLKNVIVSLNKLFSLVMKLSKKIDKNIIIQVEFIRR